METSKDTLRKRYLDAERAKQKIYDSKQYTRPEGGTLKQYRGQDRDANATLQIQRNVKQFKVSQAASNESLEQYAELAQTAQIEKEKFTQEEKKIGLLVFLIVLFLCVVGDIIDAVTGGTIGWLIGLALDLILIALAFLIKSLRAQAKDNAWTILGAIGGEKVPFLSFLPFRSALIIYLFIISRSKIAQTVVDIKGKFKGKSLTRRAA